MKTFHNATVKWAWLTDPDNPVWEYYTDFEFEDASYLHTLWSNQNGYYIEISFTYYSLSNELHLVAEVSKGYRTVQRVSCEPANYDEAKHLVEDLAFKATAWCKKH